MIASLGMYDRAETAGANDRLWALIRDGLRRRGVAAPDLLTRGAGAYWPAWTSPDLVLSQTCGLPYRAELHDKVSLIGTPDYGVQDCPPGYYRSIFVARADDPRSRAADFADAAFAYNDGLSQSGWSTPKAWFAAQGLALTPTLCTEGHAASAQAVAEGRADFAAIDAVTWSLLHSYDPVAKALKVVGQTDPSPGLPLISAASATGAAHFDAVAQAIADLAPDDRQILQLKGLVRIPSAAYLAVPIPAAPQAARPSI